MTGLAVPRTVFFDTNHLIALSKIQRGREAELRTTSAGRIEAYRRLLVSIGQGALRAVFTAGQPSEWFPANNDRNGALELARVLDAGPLPPLSVHDHAVAIVMEALREAFRIAGQNVPIPKPVRPITEEDPVFRFMVDNLPGMNHRFAALYGAEYAPWLDRLRGDLLRHTSAVDAITTFADSLNGPGQIDVPGSFQIFERGLQHARHDLDLERHDARKATLMRLSRVQMFHELLALVPEDARRRFPNEINLESCPTLQLWGKFWWRYVLQKPKVDVSDMRDVSYLAAYCYSDFSLAEGGMVSQLQQSDSGLRAKVFRAPEELVVALRLNSE